MVCEKSWDVKLLWKLCGLVWGSLKIRASVEEKSLRTSKVLYSVRLCQSSLYWMSDSWFTFQVIAWVGMWLVPSKVNNMLKVYLMMAYFISIYLYLKFKFLRIIKILVILYGKFDKIGKRCFLKRSLNAM